jgi:hypothetical protein
MRVFVLYAISEKFNLIRVTRTGCNLPMRTNIEFDSFQFAPRKPRFNLWLQIVEWKNKRVDHQHLHITILFYAIFWISHKKCMLHIVFWNSSRVLFNKQNGIMKSNCLGIMAAEIRRIGPWILSLQALEEILCSSAWCNFTYFAVTARHCSRQKFCCHTPPPPWWDASCGTRARNTSTGVL